MLGFVPQPNLHSLRFLALTEPYCIIANQFLINGWAGAAGEKELIVPLCWQKRLQSPSITAHLQLNYMSKLSSAYRLKESLAIAHEFPSDIVALRPGGGFFVWCKLPPDISAKALLMAASEHGISFLPGTRCYANGQGNDAIRLAFSFQPTQKIVEGIATLGAVLHGLRQWAGKF